MHHLVTGTSWFIFISCNFQFSLFIPEFHLLYDSNKDGSHKIARDKCELRNVGMVDTYTDFQHSSDIYNLKTL